MKVFSGSDVLSINIFDQRAANAAYVWENCIVGWAQESETDRSVSWDVFSYYPRLYIHTIVRFTMRCAAPRKIRSEVLDETNRST